MRKAFLTLTLMFVLFSTSVYAQNETNTTVNSCNNVICSSPPGPNCNDNNLITYSSNGTCSNGQCSYSSSQTVCPNGCLNGTCRANFCDVAGAPTQTSKTCPDGFVASCTPTCNRETQSFSVCEPSCAGHEATNTTAVNNNCMDSDGGKNYKIKGTVKYNLNFGQQYQYTLTDSCSGSTLNEYYCDDRGNAQTAYYACPGGCNDGKCTDAVQCPLLAPPLCGPDGFVVTGYDSNNCPRYDCKKIERPSYICGNNICEPGEADIHGGCGPDADPRCLGPPSQEGTCPRDCIQKQPCPAECECRYNNSGNITASYCKSQPACNFDNVCDRNETSSCRDCIGSVCPLNYQCPAGGMINCRQTEFGCKCEPCPIRPPPHCRQEVDGYGFLRVVCDQTCPLLQRESFDKCRNAGGIPELRKDANGCEFMDCRFNEQVKNPLTARSECPSDQNISEGLIKCEANGLKGVISFDGGCRVLACVQERSHCLAESYAKRNATIESCRDSGVLYKDFDENGCPQIRCGTAGTCRKEVPEELFKKCGESGGSVTIQRDENACITFANCVTRGNERDAFVGDIRELPDNSELLGLAFKLEQLRIDFDKLAMNSKNIADYYKSRDSKDEERYRRVASMFETARDKVDQIKLKLRNSVSDVNRSSILEVKYDIRYIKDVLLKDILFVMLGNSEDIRKIKDGETVSCGSDGICFDKAFRICQLTTFTPENGLIIEIAGLDGNNCVVKGRQVVDGQTYEMTCKILDYSLGIKSKDDVLANCTGPLVDKLMGR